MEIQVKDLMSDNEMLSHIFLGCIPTEQLMQIKEQFFDQKGTGKDWRKDSVTIPVEMKIGGVDVNPKEFFDTWRNQMKELIQEEAHKIVAEKLASQKMRELRNMLYEYEQVLKSWEADINWEVKNPLIDE